jgi:MbtH protein
MQGGNTTMMQDDEEDPLFIYKAVVNDEEQYSIWPNDRENPLGWRDAGKSGSKQECLDYIAEVWTDMRPLSLRRKMAEGVSGISTLGAGGAVAAVEGQ